MSFTEGTVAAFFLSADTLFVSIAGAASGGGGIGLYDMKVRAFDRTLRCSRPTLPTCAPGTKDVVTAVRRTSWKKKIVQNVNACMFRATQAAHKVFVLVPPMC